MGAKGEDLTRIADDTLQGRALSLAGVIETVCDSRMKRLQVMMPVKVVEVISRQSRQLTVMPLVKQLNRGGVGFSVRSPFSVKAFQYAANGFVIDFPIVKGDVGWVIAADRDTRSVMETHDYSDPDSILMHVFEGGYFIPDYYGELMDPKREGKLDPYKTREGNKEDNRLVISSFDGKQKLTIGRKQLQGEDIGDTKGDIRLDSFTDGNSRTRIVVQNGKVTLENLCEGKGETTVTIEGGTVTVSASKKIDVTTPEVDIHAPAVNIDGGSGDSAVAITGTLTVTGDITTTAGDMKKSGAITLGTHMHPTAALGDPSTPIPGA